jgi:cell division protease FtsH
VLVSILFAVGGKLSKPMELTQDQFEYKLYTGQIDDQEFKGANVIEGRLKGEADQLFTVKFAALGDREGLYQQLKAVRQYHIVTPERLEQAIQQGYYRPALARLVTSYKAAKPQPVASSGEPLTSDPVVTGHSSSAPQQEDRLFVNTLARSKAAWIADQQAGEISYGGQKPPFFLPATSGSVWLEVEGVEDFGGLLATLEKSGATVENRAFDISDNAGSRWSDQNSMLATVLLVYGPWLLIFAVFLIFMRQMRNQGAAGGVMSFGRSRAQLYSKENHTNVTFNDVAGANEAKDEVREIVEFLQNPGRFTRIGGRIPRGVLLVGPPGCGKTLLAKAIAGEAEVPFFSISGSDFVEMFVGVGASRVRDLFKQARENSPCIVFLDEIDAVGRRRGSGMGGGHDEREQTLNAILVEMDGFSTDEGIILVAATNRPDVLDPALLRPGRFDREVTIDLPDVQGRDEILKVHLKKVKSGKDVDVSTLARSTPGYSGADLAAIINEAAIMAALEKQEEIAMHHLEESRDKVRYGRQKKSRKVEEEDRRITAYHEAGHAIVAAELPEVDTPHKITIVPRGRALGATMVLPDKESYHMQRKKMLGQLAVLFGGRVSEARFCGDVSAGASDDIRRATELARAMVTELGMSDKVGPINYAERQGSDFLGSELMSGKWHSEETAREIDEEVQRLIKQGYDAAERIIGERQAAIERLVEGLLLYETVNADEIQQLIEGIAIEDLRPKPPAQSEPETRREPSHGVSEATTSGDDLSGGLPGEPGLSPA